MLVCLLVFGSMRYRPSVEGVKLVRGLSAVGLVSYGLYLWQQMFLGPPAAYNIAIPWECALLCPLIVVLSYFFLEKPLVRTGAGVSKNMISRGMGCAGPTV